jgi:hypothetical protein
MLPKLALPIPKLFKPVVDKLPLDMSDGGGNFIIMIS